MVSMESSKSEPQNLPVSSKKSPTAMTKKGVYVAISYMACAVLLVIFNKAALSSYEFPYVNVITLFQVLRLCVYLAIVFCFMFACLFFNGNKILSEGFPLAYLTSLSQSLVLFFAVVVMLSSSLILYALKRWKVISFTVKDSHTVVTRTTNLVPFKTVLNCTPVALSYLLYMLVSMESIRGISVPMYTTLRRTTVVFTMMAEYFLEGKKYSSYVVACVGIIMLGAFVAGARDLSFDYYSYTIVFVSNITTAVYLACISSIGESTGLNSFGLMWCNGIICTPILLLWTAYRGDLQATRNFPYLYTAGFQAVIFLSCALAFLLNYSVFLNTTINSALTQTVCGNLKDLFTVGFGWLVFRGLPFDLLNIVGQCLSFLGSCLYAYCKLKGI